MQVNTRIAPALVIATLVAGASLIALRAQPAVAQTAPESQIKRIYGKIVSVDLVQQTIGFQGRNKKTIILDISQALALGQVGVLPLNRGLSLWGIRGPDKLFHVQSIGHAAPTESEWGSDTDTGDPGG